MRLFIWGIAILGLVLTATFFILFGKVLIACNTEVEDKPPLSCQREIKNHWHHVSVLVLGWGGMEAKKALFMEDGLEFYRRGELLKARTQLRNYVELAPEDSHGHHLLGLLEEETGNLAASFKSYQEATKRDPSNLAPKLRTARLLLLAEKMDEAEKLIQDILTQDPEHPAGRMLWLAHGFLIDKSSGTYPPAADLIDSGANVVDETRLLAGIMSKHQQKNLAVSLLQKLLIKHPQAIAARLQLASLQTRQGSLQEAEQIIKGGEHPEAPSAELAFNLAGIYLLQKQDKLAEAHYRRVMELAQLKGFGWEAGIRLVSMLMDQGRLADVQPLLEQLRKRQPNNLYVHMFDAWILAFKGKIPESLAILHQVSKRAPRFIPGLQMFARVHIQKGENEEALGYLRQALALDGTNSATHMALGNLLVKMNQIPEAMQTFRKVLELVPGHMEAMETMVTLELKIGRTSQALLWSEYIQTVYPLLPQGYYWQGLVHQLRGNFSKARAAFEQAWERTPGSPQVVMAIVTTYTSEKQYSQALSYLEKLIPQYPDGAIYPYLQGGVLLLQNKKPEAEAAFRQALARQPDWSVPYRDLGQLRLESGDLTGSKALLENGMKIDPRDPYLHYLWGRVHMESGDLPAARQSFKKALMYQPDLENAANYLAMLLLDYPEAPEDAANALQVAKRFANSVHPDMQDTLGWAYFKNGDLDNALLFLNKAATGENREPTLYFHLGMVHEKRGDGPLARQYLQQALETRHNYDWLPKARAGLLRVAPSQ